MVLLVLRPVLRLTLLLVSFSQHLQGFQAAQEHVAQPFSENEAQQAPRGLDRDRLALQEMLARTPVGAAEGIVIPAGKRSQFTNCAALVILLREHLRTELPIEVFYNGQEERYSPALQLIEVTAASGPTAAQLSNLQLLQPTGMLADCTLKLAFSRPIQECGAQMPRCYRHLSCTETYQSPALALRFSRCTRVHSKRSFSWTPTTCLSLSLLGCLAIEASRPQAISSGVTISRGLDGTLSQLKVRIRRRECLHWCCICSPSLCVQGRFSCLKLGISM